jgi:hypothetical protein
MRLVNVPPARDGPLAEVESFKQQWRIAYGPAVDRSMVDGDAALGHHLLEIAQA